jgi:hypothetical protein
MIEASGIRQKVKKKAALNMVDIMLQRIAESDL